MNDTNQQKICLVVAMSLNKAIGKDNKLPWHLPTDLQFFKKTTMGKPVIMGRKTWESLGRALPGRENIVLSGGELTLPEGVVLAHSLQQALKAAGKYPEVCVIGGAGVFKKALELADVLYITRVGTIIEDADTFFPEYDESEWELKDETVHPADEQNKYSCTMQHYERR